MTTTDHHALLALDTSVATARVALMNPAGRLLASAEKTAARHSANLLRLIDEVLGAAGMRVADLGGIACGRGPGSFTGLRVGLAVAKGLALPTGISLVLVSSLEALALDLDGAPDALVVPCIDAGKGQVYGQLFRGGDHPRAVGDAWVLDPADLVARIDATREPAVVGGSGVDRHEAVFRAGLAQEGAAGLRLGVAGPSARSVGALARPRLAQGDTDDLGSAVPAYGRPPDITKPRRPAPRSGV